MPLIQLNIRFPSSNQVIVEFSHEESETLAFQSPVTKKDLEDLRWYTEVLCRAIRWIRQIRYLLA